MITHSRIYAQKWSDPDRARGVRSTRCGDLAHRRQGHFAMEDLIWWPERSRQKTCVRPLLRTYEKIGAKRRIAALGLTRARLRNRQGLRLADTTLGNRREQARSRASSA